MKNVKIEAPTFDDQLDPSFHCLVGHNRAVLTSMKCLTTIGYDLPR